MKKIFLSILLIFSLTLSTVISIKAAPVEDDFDFTVYDNEKYDLLTGLKESDVNYSITNKILLYRNLIDDEVVFSNDDFHHVLFFNEYSAYMGYVNTDKSDLQLSTWIDGDVATDGTLTIPDGVDKIALMNYNYDDTRDLVIYENEDIDNIAWDFLSYRDIFQGTNLIANGDFDDTTPTAVNTRNLFDEEWESGYYSYTTGLPLTHPTFIRGVNPITVSASTTYSVQNADDYVFSLRYFDSSDTFLSWENTSTTFTTPATTDYIRVGAATDTDIDWTSSQIEIGSTATNYIADEITVDYPNDWYHSQLYMEVIDGEMYIYDNPELHDNARQNFTADIYIDDIIYNSFDIIDYNVVDTGFFYYGYSSGNSYIGWSSENNFTQGFNSFLKTATVDVSPTNNYQLWLHDTVTTGGYVILDNINMYNFTDIFTTNLPDIAEFETMKLYYDTYKDAVDEITYNDIFESDLITNGDFSDALSSNDWTGGSETDIEIIDNELVVTNTPIASGKTDIYAKDGSNNIEFFNTHIYYRSAELVYNSEISINVNYRLTNSHYMYMDAIGVFSQISEYILADGGYLNFVYYEQGYDYEYIIDNVFLYDLTDIFGYVETEIDTDWIELHYLTWLDPLGEDTYAAYYPAANLITLDINYFWDDTPAADPDAITSIDEGLVKMGVLTDELKVFLAFAIMIVLAIFIGLSTHNSTFIILGEVVLIIIFTMLGWFSFWILLLMALIFTLLILRAGLKGGNE